MRDDELDRMIDAGLSTYGEPRAGLDKRVLAAVAVARIPHTPRLSNWRVWALGVPAAACILIGLFVAMRFVTTPHAHEVQTAHATAATAARNAVPFAAAGALRHHATHASVRVSIHAHAPAHAQSLPKREVFPTPQPLSPEMQALVTYLAEAPEKERQKLVEFQAQQDAPIRIAPIQISPIDASAKD